MAQLQEPRPLRGAARARWFEHFPRDQILVLPSEPFFEDPGPTLAAVFGFLGLPGHTPSDLEALNVGDNRQRAARVRGYLDDCFAPHNEALARLRGSDLGFWSDLLPQRAQRRRKASRVASS